MIFLGSRIFTTKDTIAFSKLSKDKNRIHFDNKICNFTQYNNPIVQGALILISIFDIFLFIFTNMSTSLGHNNSSYWFFAVWTRFASFSEDL